MDAVVYQTRGDEDGSVYVLARLKKKNSSHDMVIVAVADFTSIIRNVRLRKDNSTVHGPTTMSAAGVILAALSTGNIWTKDATGFNFIDLVPAAAFPTADVFRIEYMCTLTSGETYPLKIDHTAGETLAS